MSRPIPTGVMHFTRVEHLPTILERGLLSDSRAQAEGVLSIEVGNVTIKGRRASRAVPCPPGGVVSDYVPMYFAERSPMMYSIYMGGVSTYQDGCNRLIYITSTLESIAACGLPAVLTDRNASLQYAEFRQLSAGVPDDGFIDWPLMRQRMWNSTYDDPDRGERRQAECLVHDSLPVAAFEEVVARSNDVADEAEYYIRDAGLNIPVNVRRGWYF